MSTLIMTLLWRWTLKSKSAYLGIWKGNKLYLLLRTGKVPRIPQHLPDVVIMLTLI